jgi:pimeloyl-ACP methyl ester carboxylesterase
MTIAKASGIDLAWDHFGREADPPILLIAGLGVQMIRWADPFCEELAARGYRVIRFDNRDAGCSTHFSQHAPPDFGALAAALMAGRRPEVPYTLPDMAADVVGLLDALAIDRAHVVGLSMGGMIAQIMASKHPERVLSLTSIMSGTGNPALPQAEPDVMAMMMQPRRIRSWMRPDFWRAASPSRAASPARAIRSTRRRIASSFWRRSLAPMIRAAPDGRSPPWPWPAIVARASPPSACRRSSSMERTIR